MTDQTQGGSAPQPGWYQDPSGPGYRWWDGTTWTDQTHPGTQQAAAAPAPAPTPAAPAAPVAPTANTPAVQADTKPAKKQKNVPGASNWLNDNPIPVVLALAAVLIIVVVLFVL
jgi:hypothetical protein